jgi:beta-lactamase regulating signal transducer with metallopeptidase domain
MTTSALNQAVGFVSWLLQSSLEACVLIGLILAFQAVLRNRLSAGWRHAFWLLLLARLLVPWSPSSALSVYNLIPSEWNRTFRKLPPVPLEGPTSALAVGVPAVFAESSIGIEYDGAAGISIADRGNPRLHVLSVAGCIWLVGALVLGILILRRSVALALGVRRRPCIGGAEIERLMKYCKRSIGCRREVRVVETPGVSVPALFGIMHPCVLLPTGATRTMPRESLRHVFLHELAHLKRHDLVISWLASVLQVVHWFNPLVWYALRRMRTDRELACDALVLSRLGREESEEYGRTLVYLSERFCRRRSLPCATGFFEGKSQIRRRIEMIANLKRGAGSSQWIALVAMIVLACVTLTGAKNGASAKKGESVDKADLIVPGERVGQFTFDVTKAELVDKLGEPKRAFYGEHTFDLDDLPKEYYFCFDELSFYINDGHVHEITVLRPRWKLPNGLTVGSTEKEVKEAMGSDFHFRAFPRKDFLTYANLGLSFEIDKEERTVMEINVQSKRLRERTRALVNDLEAVAIPGERVGPFKFGATKEELLDELGEPRAVFYGEHSFSLDNLPPRYFLVFDELSFGMKDGRVQGITLLSPRWKLRNGLRVGAPEKEVKKALGDEFELREFPAKDFLIYQEAGLSFEVDKEKRTVMEINLLPKR